jgi:hypothetical protein
MIERGEELRLAFKPRQPVTVRGERFGQDLDRDVALQLRVARAIHLAHAARAERGHHFVRAEPLTGR